MNVVYAKEAPPEAYSKSLFLAGPTPRSSQVASWRPEALELLAASGYDGVVFVPEPRDGIWQGDYEEQIAWEEACLHRADCILFWVPRDLQTLPAFTTNVEFGVWHASGKVVFGAPDEAPKNTYLKYYAAKCHVPTADSLVDSVAAALKMIGPGALRRGGEREIPFGIWKTASFQQWYRAQTQAGNRLDGARVV
ncbi:MAG TPA: nucleoside 2-deoxyribosyltransferase domain-containing protein, partial [Chthonomonadaceae bacterium]|nr:nucleoside 2-deoxyribosyltransferase domain-containing protein [Chthonomonadaceae bacterium]